MVLKELCGHHQLHSVIKKITLGSHCMLGSVLNGGEEAVERNDTQSLFTRVYHEVF